MEAQKNRFENILAMLHMVHGEAMRLATTEELIEEVKSLEADNFRLTSELEKETMRADVAEKMIGKMNEVALAKERMGE